MAHDCVQDAKIRQLCLDVGVQKEKIRVLKAGQREVFEGDNSMKSRLIRAEDCIETIDDNIKGYFSGMKWFIGILVVIQIAAFGGLTSFMYWSVSSHTQQQQVKTTIEGNVPDFLTAEGHFHNGTRNIP